MTFQNKKFSSIIFAGHFAIDTIIRFKRRSKPSLGGSVSYCSLALSTYSQDINISIISHLGKLNFDYSLLDGINHKNIDLKGIKYSESNNTQFVLDYYNHSRTLTLKYRSPNLEFNDIPVEYLDKPPDIIVLVPLCNEISIDYVSQIVDQFPNIYLGVDLQGFLRKIKEDGKVAYIYDDQIISNMDEIINLIGDKLILKGSEEEMKLLAGENEDIYKPNKNTEGPLRHSDKPYKEFKRQPVDPEKVDIPETKEKKLPPPKKEDKLKRRASPAGGWKVKDVQFEQENPSDFFIDEMDPIPLIYKMEKKMSSILDNIRKDRKVSDFGGRGIGRRIKMASSQKGRYVSYRSPINRPKSIALDATIRNYLKNVVYNQTDISFPIQFDKYDLMDKIYEYRAPLALFFVLDSSASMYYVIKQMTDVILSLQKEGYRKKDKLSLIVFRGKEAIVLQKPTVYFKNAIGKLKKIEGKSYTPMAAALKKCTELIKVEKMKNRNIIPVIFICSDCGANISVKHPDLIAQVESDYMI